MSDTPCCSSSTSSLCSVLLVVSCRDARDKRERDRGGGCDRVSEQGGQVSKPVKLRGLTVQLHDYGKSATKIKIKNKKCCSECGFRQEETCPVPFPSFGTMKCVLVGRECAAVRADALSFSLSRSLSLCWVLCCTSRVQNSATCRSLQKKYSTENVFQQHTLAGHFISYPCSTDPSCEYLISAFRRAEMLKLSC